MKPSKLLKSAILLAILFLLPCAHISASAVAADSTGVNEGQPAGTRQKIVSDKRGKTIRYLDSHERLIKSIRRIDYGPDFGRETVTVYTYNQGHLMSADATNKLMHRQEFYNSKGLVQKAVQDDNYGLEWSRHNEMDAYEYDAQGLLKKNAEKNRLETVVHLYNPDGQVIEDQCQRAVGLGAKRETLIKNTYNPATGKPLKRRETNAYGMIETTEFDPATDLPAKQSAAYNYGLGATRETKIQYQWDPHTGLPRHKTDTNTYGVTQTDYDTLNGGSYGIPVKSLAKTNFDLLDTRETETAIETDPRHGLTRRTASVNKHESRKTDYDTLLEGLYGVPVKIQTKRNTGLEYQRHSLTDVEVNNWTGLYKKTSEHYLAPEKGK